MSSVRERIQQQRKELNKQIFKSYKTYQGAENLVKATDSRELKEKAVLELSYIQSQWAVLRDKLQELNSKIESYQNSDGKTTFIMLAVGLKDSVELDKSSKLRYEEIILEHYGEEPDNYEKELQQYFRLRAEVLNPPRNEDGVRLLKTYFNHLFIVENRFFPPDAKSNGIFFSWFDCLCGTLHTQFSIDFEKACVLFNMGCLHSQIATKQDRSTLEGAEQALKHYQMAAGIFKFLGKFFVDTPCPDLSEKCQEVLRFLMLAQAQECLFDRIALSESDEKCNNSKLLDYILNVVESYKNLEIIMRRNTDVPQAWLVLISAKHSHYMAVAHYYAAKLCVNMATFPCEIYSVWVENEKKAKHVAQAYVDICVEKHVEALRKVKSNRHLKHIDSLVEILQHAASRSNDFSKIMPRKEEDLSIDFLNVQPLLVLDPSKLVTEIEPDFEVGEVEDIFALLGPGNVFNARNNWSAPKKVVLVRKNSKESFGFTVRGNAPVAVEAIDIGGLAEKAGLIGGELIVNIDGEDVKWALHKEVVALIKAAGNSVTIHTVTMIQEESKFLTL